MNVQNNKFYKDWPYMKVSRFSLIRLSNLKSHNYCRMHIILNRSSIIHQNWKTCSVFMQGCHSYHTGIQGF